MSSGRLLPRHAFGLVHNSTNCVAFSEDRNLVYSAGGFTVVINTESKEQSFISSYASQIPGHVSQGATAIACCHSKKYIAVAERAVTGALVILYDSHSLRKKKVLVCAELGSPVIKCISFSECGRYCLTQGGSPEWNLVLWAIDSKNPKILSVVKVAVSDDTPVHQVSFCPWDSTHIVVIGKNLIKFFRILEGTLRPAIQTVRKDQANFISHCWIPDDILVLGTESGEILLLENNDYRGAIYPTGADHEELTPVHSIVGTTRGFISGNVDGELRAFERRADKRDEWEVKFRHSLPEARGKVLSLVMGPDDYLAVATDQQQLYHVNVGAIFSDHPSKQQGPRASIFEPITSPFHAPNVRGDAAITAIDAALWRPIVATCGRDKTVRIWNVSDMKMESVHEFEEEPLSVAMHPSGLYIAVGFLEKVQIVALLLDGFSICREVSVRACNFVKFAHGGHFFAVCAGTVVQIFHTHTGGLAATLRGHTNKIKSFTWLDMDSRCVTVGGEGACYYWDLFPTPVRSTEKIHTAMVPFQTGAGPSDGTRAYLSTAEKVIRELSFSRLIDPTTGLESPLKEPRDVESSRLVGSMVFDESKRMLLVGTCDEDGPGTVLAMLTMPQLSSNMEHSTLHAGPITAMCLSPDGSTVFTGDLHGCLVVSEFDGSSSRAVGSPTKVRGEGLVSFDFQDEVAIHKATLDAKKRLIADLTVRIEELTLNNEHQLRLKEMEHRDKMAEIATKYGALLADEHTKYENQTQTRSNMVDAHTAFSGELDHKQATELRVMETKYKVKQNAEDIRHKNLLSEVQETHSRWNEENVALVTSHQAYIKELCGDYEEQLAEEHVLQQQFLKEKEELHVAGAATQSHIELDGDLEIFEMNSRFEQRLRQEDAVGKELMGQHALIRKQLQLLVKDGDQQREEIKRLRERESRLADTVRSLERDIQLHKKEVREREETITDKEKRIFDLKKKNQELEKFRFVLDYKIRELKLQIAPREQDTAALRRQSEEMALELEQYHKSGQALELMLQELKLKAEGLRKELVSQEERCSANSRLIEKFKRDLRGAWTVHDDVAAFRARVVKLYRVYVQEDVSGSGEGDASDPQEVYNRDREQLERSLEALRRALKTDGLAHKRDLGKMMREGVLLVGELNTLRKDARQLQLQKKAIEEAGGIGPKTDLLALMAALGLDNKKKKKKDPPKGGILPPTPPTGQAGAKARSAALRSVTPHGAGQSTSMLTDRGKGDQWAVWREIHLQTQQMQELESSLHATCYSLSLDPLSILVAIDGRLAEGY